MSSMAGLAGTGRKRQTGSRDSPGGVSSNRCSSNRPVVQPGCVLQRLLPHDLGNQDESHSLGQRGREQPLRGMRQRWVRLSGRRHKSTQPRRAAVLLRLQPLSLDLKCPDSLIRPSASFLLVWTCFASLCSQPKVSVPEGESCLLPHGLIAACYLSSSSFWASTQQLSFLHRLLFLFVPFSLEST